ncbi:MAG: MFS transporter, partial [Enterobacterales bacterium]|nr:MFS transporter [Enterobacterales bacterium]
CAVLAVIWLAVSMTMKEPPYVSSLRIVIPDAIPATPELEQALKQLHGVADVVLIPEEKTAYVKIDSKLTNRGDIELFVAGQTV